jgi:hypothetical protein
MLQLIQRVGLQGIYQPITWVGPKPTKTEKSSNHNHSLPKQHQENQQQNTQSAITQKSPTTKNPHQTRFFNHQHTHNRFLPPKHNKSKQLETQTGSNTNKLKGRDPFGHPTKQLKKRILP